MNTDLKTLATRETATPTTTATRTTATDTPAPARTGWIASLRRAVRTRRAERSELSRQIAAYPAMRSVSSTALLTARTDR